jgi:CHAT domain-containing protein/tetratricopeptide (TPR) repeat protein
MKRIAAALLSFGALVMICGAQSPETAPRLETAPQSESASPSGPVQQRFIPLSEQAVDPQSLRQLIMLGRYEEAEKRAREILAQAPNGDRSTPEATEALLWLGDALLRQAREKLPETHQVIEDSVELSRKVFGERHLNYALSLGNLGTLRYRTDDFQGARDAFHQAMSILEEAKGKDSADLALMMNRLATVEGATGHFVEAGMLMERAVSIVDSLPVLDRPELGNILQNMGVYLDNSGDILGAEKSDLRALEFRRHMLPSPHPQIAYVLMDLGSIREKLGDYTSARSMLEESLAMSEQTLGPNHRQVGQILADLALLSADTGRLDLAIQYQERAVAIARAVRGDDNSETWQVISGLGGFRARAGDWEGALTLLRQALAGQEKKFGPVHQEVGATVMTLARVEAESGDAASAREHYQRGIEVFSKMFGPKHPRIADGLDGLAHLSLAAGDLVSADSALRQAQVIREEILGPDHPDVAEGLVDLARLEWRRGDGAAALGDAFRAEAILQRHFGAAIRGFSEREALAYQRIRATGLGVAFSVLASLPPAGRPGDALTEVWNAVVRSRSLVLDQVASRHEFAGVRGGGAAPDLMRRLAASANRLARVVVQGPSVSHPETYRARFEQALAEKEKLEHELATLAEGSGGSPVGADVSLHGVASALPDGTGLAAFVQFPWSQSSPATSPAGGGSGEPVPAGHYGILFIRKDDATPRFQDLGSVADIDALVSGWRQQTMPPRSGSMAADSHSERDYRRAGARLRERIWDPFADSLRGLKQVLIVPEGSIALVSFAALPSGADRYVLETSPVLHYLSAERDLLRAPDAATEPTRALMIGNPDFDVPPPQLAASPGPPAQIAATLGPAPAVFASTRGLPAEGAPFRGTAPGCQDFQKLHFDVIPGAGNEITQVESQILGAAAKGGVKPIVAELTGPRASEPSFKQWAPDATLIHLATHGFFLGGCNDAPGAAAQTTATAAVQTRAAAASREGISPVHDDPLRGEIDLANPLLLSGLALAGANQRAHAGADADDGVLTSEEIAAMDLSSARWVVLSACETGLGTIQAGEGVLGLRRAFRLAGARTIIMSLWKVDDRATLAWMQRLYERRDAGMSTAEAVWQASLDSLKERRAGGRSTHPFYWGAFVAAGDWR